MTPLRVGSITAMVWALATGLAAQNAGSGAVLFEGARLITGERAAPITVPNPTSGSRMTIRIPLLRAR